MSEPGSPPNQVGAFLCACLLCFGTQGIGWLLTAEAVREWYPGISKPSWTPPEGLFGPVWTLFFLLSGFTTGFYFPTLPNPWLYQAVTFGVATVVAGVLVFSYRRGTPARWALNGYFAAFVLLELGWFVISPTRPWLEAARWFRGLSLT
jgi:benzodiazapine receptor